MKRPSLVALLLILSLVLTLTGCTRTPIPDNDSLGGGEEEELLLHSVIRSEETFSDAVLGLQSGAKAPSTFQGNKQLVVLGSGRERMFSWLLSLIEAEWAGAVTIVGKESLDLDINADWEVLQDPELMAEIKTNVFPALYIIEKGIIVFRSLPAVPTFSMRVIEGLRGNYANSTTYAETGQRLPQANLENRDGSPWSNHIRRNSVFVVVDTSCFVCAPAVEWAASLTSLDADIYLVITASSNHRYDNLLYLQQAHPELVPGEFEPPGTEEGEMLDEYLRIFGKQGNVLIDRQDSACERWGINSWPCVIITDKDGLVVEKMVLSLGSGRIDGSRFAYPSETVEGVLARLPR